MLLFRTSALSFILFAACSGGARAPDAGDDASIDADANDGALTDGSNADANDAEAGAQPPCDLFTQTGCAPNERCGLTPAHVPGCIAVGVKVAYEDCDPNAAVDECGRGYTCARSPDSPAVPYQCTAFCTGTMQGTCGAWETCVSQQGIPAKICTSLTTCRPVAQDCPPRQDGIDDCYIIEGHSASCLAADASPLAIGATCTITTQCEVGSSCIRIAVGNDARRCMKHCDPSAAAPGCPPSTVCSALGPSGVCR